jgi:glycosyltransferase involved in cell wall biosynthesis
MACGTPVVALRGGAVPEVSVDKVTGLICDQPAELPAAIERARELDPADCRRHVAANFGVAQLGSGYERIYQQVLSSRIAPDIRPPVARVVEGAEPPCTGLREDSQKASA